MREDTSGQQRPGLRRSLGLLETTVGGVGLILGAGIYALVGEAAGKAGNAVWLSFALAAGMAALTGLSYAELASAYPRAGADYEYSRQALGRRFAAVVGWVIVSGNVIAAAAVALGFGGYFGEFVDVAPTLAALLALTAAAAIAAYGIREAMWASILLTVVEIAGLLLIIGIGVPHLGDVSLVDTRSGASGVFSGAALVIFAFIGFEQIATLSEETHDARRTVPAALLLALVFSTAVYIAVAVAAVSVVGWEALSESEAPLAAVASEVLGSAASDVLSAIALFSTFNTMLLMLVAASRLLYGMATTGSLPALLGAVHRGSRTPVAAIALCAAGAIGVATLGDIGFVAQSANFAIILGFAAVNISLIVLRFRRPGIDRPFRLPLSVGRVPVLPVLALGGAVFMIANLQLNAILLGLALVVTGALLMLTEGGIRSFRHGGTIRPPEDGPNVTSREAVKHREMETIDE
jgi:APA family basic amino acid/polyamine antiporter